MPDAKQYDIKQIIKALEEDIDTLRKDPRFTAAYIGGVLITYDLENAIELIREQDKTIKKLKKECERKQKK